MFQTPKSRKLDRADHVWTTHYGRSGWICCLCGALTTRPPDYPTPGDWLPTEFVKLTDAERALCPPAR